MIYLSGVARLDDFPAFAIAGIGVITSPKRTFAAANLLTVEAWAADNGCFGSPYNEERHLAWLDAQPREGCLFAVAPDVYPDAQATLDLSRRFFDLIREMGFPVALVAQDGAEDLDLPWDDFDCLFIGGEAKRPEWKVSEAAEDVARRARAHGKWVHMGRVNSLKRMERARSMGCHSADGTFIKYRRRVRAGETVERDGRGASELTDWRSWLYQNPPLPLSRFETPSLPVHRAALGLPILEAL